MKEIRTAQELLESMTPDGSECASDPEACAKWVRDYIDNLEHNVKRLVHQRNEVTQKLYHLLDILAGTPELLERAAGLAEIATCNLCPERNKCSAFLQNTESQPHPCDVIAAELRKLAQALRALEEEEEG